MIDLELDLEKVAAWFPHTAETPYVLIRVSPEHAQAWAGALGLAVRRCYITDVVLAKSAESRSLAQSDVIAAKLPDAGSTMAGDFGEILVYLYQAAREHPRVAMGATKWRLKQDRGKPAPYSDVVHLVLPSWPTPGTDDIVLCSEVKAKSTKGGFAPIKKAIEGCEKDKTSRLADTLVWLRERAYTEDLGDLKIEHLNRFIDAIDHPPAEKRFRAVAIVAEDLLPGELADAPKQSPAGYSVVVIAVPELRATYTAVFEAARQAIVAAEAALAGETPA